MNKDDIIKLMQQAGSGSVQIYPAKALGLNFQGCASAIRARGEK